MTLSSGRSPEHSDPENNGLDREHDDLEKDTTEDELERNEAIRVAKVSQLDPDVAGLQQQISSQDSTTPQFPVDRKTELHPRQSQEGSKDEAAAGVEVQFDGLSDPMHPYNRGIIHKWVIVLIISSCSLCVTCVSSIYTTTYDQLEPAFDISTEVATLGLTTYVMGLACGPLFLSPLSEFYGRRWVYIVSYGLFLIWLIPCAVARNVVTMSVARYFDGLVGSAFLSVAGGTIGDMFPKDQLSMPMMIYTASPFVGPQVGPIVGGFINYYINWRWSFYVLMIWAGFGWVSLVLLVPETYTPVLLRRKAQKLRETTGDTRWQAPIERMNKSVTKTVLWSCIRPFELLCFEPMCLNLCLLSAILLGIIYLFFGAFPIIFGENYDFNGWQNGLAFPGLMVGLIIGVCCDPITRRNYDRLVRSNGGISEPEFRLPPTIVGAVMVPIGLLGFAWTTYSFVHWIVPIIFSGIFGWGNILCFGGIFTFLVESYPLYAASALAANSFARSVFAASFPLFGTQMYNTLGFQWASSLLGFIALAMAPFPYLFFKLGKRIRRNSRFASDYH